MNSVFYFDTFNDFNIKLVIDSDPEKAQLYAQYFAQKYTILESPQERLPKLSKLVTLYVTEDQINFTYPLMCLHTELWDDTDRFNTPIFIQQHGLEKKKKALIAHCSPAENDPVIAFLSEQIRNLQQQQKPYPEFNYSFLIDVPSNVWAA